jgi:hypothetical protein
MRPSAAVHELLGAVAGRLGAGGEVSSSGAAGLGGWLATLSSVLAVLVVGSVAARMARRLTRNSTPELIVLLNQSAAFYVRWPEDQLAHAPRDAVMSEAIRCGRIVELLEARRTGVVNDGSVLRGAVDGVATWIAVLHREIGRGVNVPSGPTFA